MSHTYPLSSVFTSFSRKKSAAHRPMVHCAVIAFILIATIISSSIFHPNQAYQDALQRPSSLWPQNQTCVFGADGYHLRGPAYCPAPAFQQDNFRLSIEVKDLRDGPQGHAFGLTLLGRNNTAYFYGIDSAQEWFVNKSAGKKQQRVGLGGNPIIRPGLTATNTLEIVVSAGRLNLSVNGTLLDQIADPALSSINPVLLNSGTGSEVVFTNIKMLHTAATPLQSVHSNVIYQNSLLRPSPLWLQTNVCSSNADGFHLHGSAYCPSPISQQSDFRLSIDVKNLKEGAQGHSFGLQLVNQDDGFYLYGIDSAQEWIVLKGDTKELHYVDIGTSDAIHPGLNATNTLEMHVSGGRISLSVNGTELDQIADPAFSNVSVQLANNDFGDKGSETVFTNIKVLHDAAAISNAPSNHLYQNSLRTASNLWLQNEQCRFDPDGYHILGSAQCPFPGSPQSAFTLSIDVKVLNDGAQPHLFGLILGDKVGAYLYVIDPAQQRWFVFKSTGNGVENSGLGDSSAIRSDTNTLEIHVSPGSFDVSVNSVRLDQIADPTLSNVSSVLFNDGAGSEVVFTNAKLTYPA